MRKSGRKLSDYTCNSPSNCMIKTITTIGMNENGELNMSGKSHKSKYSNSSKLTQSQLFYTISKANQKKKSQQILKERDVEIQILENSLQAIYHNQLNFLGQVGHILKEYSELAFKIQAELQLQQKI